MAASCNVQLLVRISQIGNEYLALSGRGHSPKGPVLWTGILIMLWIMGGQAWCHTGLRGLGAVPYNSSQGLKYLPVHTASQVLFSFKKTKNKKVAEMIHAKWIILEKESVNMQHISELHLPLCIEHLNVWCRTESCVCSVCFEMSWSASMFPKTTGSLLLCLALFIKTADGGKWIALNSDW